MHQQPFNDAVLTCKLLLLLGDAFAGDKEVEQRLRRLHHDVEASVITLALRPRNGVDAFIEEYLDYVSGSIFDFFGELPVDDLVRGTPAVFSNARSGIFAHLSFLGSGHFPTDDGKGVSSFLTATSHPKYENLVAAFRHICVRDEWLSTLVALGADISDISTTRLLTQLAGKWAAPQGRESLLEAHQQFLDAGLMPDTADCSVGDAMVVTVRLSPMRLVQLSKVRDLSRDCFDVSPHMADLLAAAAQPVLVSPGISAKSVATQKMADLMQGLQQRETAVAAARKHHHSPGPENRIAAALDTLRANRELVEVLREHPELLNEV